jgi:hypothetical protein
LLGSGGAWEVNNNVSDRVIGHVWLWVTPFNIQTRGKQGYHNGINSGSKNKIDIAFELGHNGQYNASSFNPTRHPYHAPRNPSLYKPIL